MKAIGTLLATVTMAMLIGCDQQGSRYVDPSKQAGYALNQAQSSSYSPYSNQGVYQGSGGGITAYSSSECYQQCLADANGQVPETCPQHCAEYNIKSMRGLYFDQDLNPTVSFQTAFGASRLGNSLGQPSVRTQLINEYFQGQSGGYLPYQSQLFNQMYPRGIFQSEGEMGPDVTLKNANDVYAATLLDQAAYRYQVNDPGAPQYYYQVRQHLQSQGPSQFRSPQFDFSKIENMFKGFGESFRNAGVGLANGFVGAGASMAQGLAGAGSGMSYGLAGAGSATSGLSNYQFAGMSWQNGATYLNNTMYGVATNGIYRTGP